MCIHLQYIVISVYYRTKAKKSWVNGYRRIRERFHMTENLGVSENASDAIWGESHGLISSVWCTPQPPGTLSAWRRNAANITCPLNTCRLFSAACRNHPRQCTGMERHDTRTYEPDSQTVHKALLTANPPWLDPGTAFRNGKQFPREPNSQTSFSYSVKTKALLGKLNDLKPEVYKVGARDSLCMRWCMWEAIRLFLWKGAEG